MIKDIDDALKTLLATELRKIPGCPVIDPGQITFDPPAEAAAAQDGEARINLYLCDLRENVEMRDENYRMVRAPVDETRAGRRQTPIRVDLTYLVTVHAGNDPTTEHRLLSDVLGTFLLYLAIPTAYLRGALEGLGPTGTRLMVGQPQHLDLMNPTGMWQALESKMRPSLVVVVNAPFDPFETKWSRRVRSLGYGFTDGTNAGSAADRLSEINASATGIVLDQQNEKPLADVSVNVEGYAGTATDSNGIFILLNLPAGKQTLTLRAHGYRDIEVITVVPPPGRTDQIEPLVVAMHGLDRSEREINAGSIASKARKSAGITDGDRSGTISITGTVLLPDGTPAVFIPVRAGESVSSTNADGVYYFFDLLPGEYKVIATIPGSGNVEVDKKRIK